MKEKTISILDKWAVAFHPTGSRYICDPPVTDTDEDIVCLGTDELVMTLDLAGFSTEGDPERYEGMSDFVSYRLSNINLIVTQCPAFYKAFVDATEQAKAKNLTDKAERIALFQSVLYGAQPFEIPL